VRTEELVAACMHVAHTWRVGPMQSHRHRPQRACIQEIREPYGDWYSHSEHSLWRRGEFVWRAIGNSGGARCRQDFCYGGVRWSRGTL
jgi:hypothetical protein